MIFYIFTSSSLFLFVCWCMHAFGYFPSFSVYDSWGFYNGTHLKCEWSELRMRFNVSEMAAFSQHFIGFLLPPSLRAIIMEIFMKIAYLCIWRCEKKNFLLFYRHVWRVEAEKNIELTTFKRERAKKRGQIYDLVRATFLYVQCEIFAHVWHYFSYSHTTLKREWENV